MKLRIKVDGKMYDVEVERAEPVDIGSAASRVEGAPLGTALPKMPPRAGPKPIAASSARTEPAAAATANHESAKAAANAVHPDPPVDPPIGGPRPPWHDLTIGNAGEVLAPVPGSVLHVLVKVGDAVKVNDALVHIEVSKVLSPQEQPLVGTIRAAAGGTVADVLVKTGEKVGFGQVMVKLKGTPEAPAQAATAAAGPSVPQPARG